jgi:hypothetical protein
MISHAIPSPVTPKAAITNVMWLMILIPGQAAHPRFDPNLGKCAAHPHQDDGTEQQAKAQNAF